MVVHEAPSMDCQVSSVWYRLHIYMYSYLQILVLCFVKCELEGTLGRYRSTDRSRKLIHSY